MGERYSANTENPRWRVVNGEAVIINLSNTPYYALNKTGTFIWGLLSERELDRDEIAREVTARFDVRRETAANDVREILEQLEGRT
jgi:Coenzyme PQQ synthesis protein D (PqqD)